MTQGKGSARRPTRLTQDDFANAWARTFARPSYSHSRPDDDEYNRRTDYVPPVPARATTTGTDTDVDAERPRVEDADVVQDVREQEHP